MSPPEISVVIPLFNEADNVAELQRQIVAALADFDYEIIFMNDGSTDATRDRITPGPRIRVLDFEKNSGQSAAMFAGAHAAKGARIVFLDGDLQNDPADIPRLLAELDNGSDLVCGYRAKRRDNLAKKISSRVANAVRSRFVGDGVRDTGCSLKAMRAECVRAFMPFRGMHRFIPALVKAAGYRIKEIPVNHRPRTAGVSKYKFGTRVFRATNDMFGVHWLIARRLEYRIREEKNP